MLTNSGRPANLAAICTGAAGLIFCLWVLTTGGEALCVTDGCSIFHDFRFAGYSLWEAGAALFSALTLLCVFKLTLLALLASGAALLADTFLLGVMLFTAPCLNCLIVGAFTAVCYLCILNGNRRGKESGRSLLACLWTLLFLFNIGGLVKDVSEPWAVISPAKPAPVNIWFSPSCPACLRLLEHFQSFPDAAWHPVAEDARDIHVIHAMMRNLEQGMPLPEAAEKAGAAIPAPFAEDPGTRLAMIRPSMLLLQFRLWINQAHVLEAGSGRLPLLEFAGMPSFLSGAPGKKPAAQAADGPAAQAPPLPDMTGEGPAAGNAPVLQAPVPEARPNGQDWSSFGVAGFCGGDKKEPCRDGEPEISGQGIDIGGMQ